MITIDVVSDVVCPWCYIGKRRLEKAIKQLDNQYDIQIIYHPFQLDPSVPKEGVAFLGYMNRKFGGDALSKFGQVEQAGAGEGLDFDFAELPKAINTFDLHRILHIAKQEGKQAEANEALMQAYFVERIDLTMEENLTNTFAKIGWSDEKTLSILHSEQAALDVKQEIKYFQKMGVSGVPFFILNNKYALSGAQPSSVFMEAIQQVADEMGIKPKPVLMAEGEVCEIETGNC